LLMRPSSTARRMWSAMDGVARTCPAPPQCGQGTDEDSSTPVRMRWRDREDREPRAPRTEGGEFAPAEAAQERAPEFAPAAAEPGAPAEPVAPVRAEELAPNGAAEALQTAPEPAPTVPEPEPVAVVLTPPDPDRPKRAGWWSKAKAAISGSQ
ncbi:MAG TPA: hypothetical protein VE443_05215, partial [Beijerinckiaceae bacterium]|nr:hypothetical protein [Beijerinckiaceae bacterium]